MATEVHVTGTCTRADADIEAGLFRIAQEGLSNVAKHANASKVCVTLTYLDDMLLLDIVDDGVGIAAGAAERKPSKSHGYGLIGMRERLQRVGGTLTVESAHGAGTTVNATVPLPQPAAGGER